MKSYSFIKISLILLILTFTTRLHPEPDKHFKDNGNGTITDSRTDLMWMKDFKINLN